MMEIIKQVSCFIAILNKNNIDIAANENEIYDFIISIAEGELDCDAIVEWLNKNTVAI